MAQDVGHGIPDPGADAQKKKQRYLACMYKKAQSTDALVIIGMLNPRLILTKNCARIIIKKIGRCAFVFCID